VIVLGYITFALVYLGFAFVSSSVVFVMIFIAYGGYTAVITGAERAMISEISPPNLKGTMLGLHSTIVGVALFPASVIAGILWDAFGVFAPFLFGASLSLVAAIILMILFNSKSMPSYNIQKE
jgi:predicted MFS family arabinose efflux permease